MAGTFPRVDVPAEAGWSPPARERSLREGGERKDSIGSSVYESMENELTSARPDVSAEPPPQPPPPPPSSQPPHETAVTTSPTPPSDPPAGLPPTVPEGTMAPNAPVYQVYGYGQSQTQQQQSQQPQWPHSGPYRMAPGWEPPRYRAPRVRPKAQPFRPIELGAVLAMAIAIDIAMYSKERFETGGFGLSIFFVALPVALFVAARTWRASWRLGAITALLGLVAARCFFQPTPGTIFSGLGLLLAFGFTLRLKKTFVPDAVFSMFAAIGKLPSRVVAAGAGVRKIASRTRLGNVSLLPIVIPAGLVLVFLGVFALANPVVAHGLSVGWSAVSSVVTFPSVGRVFLFIVSLGLGIALLRPALRRAKGSELATPPVDETTSTTLLVARNALVGLNVLFLGYNAIDARYLWAGSPPSGMHTQQYAHEGAFWLTVALLMLTAVIGVMFKGPLAHDPNRSAITIRRLAYGWMAQGLVLGLGTYRRIAIHIAKSGLSDLRIVGILGTTLVVGGVVLIALKLRNKKTFTWLVRRQLDAFAITAVLYAIFPTHLISARVNVARVNNGEYRPILHSFRQSHETESAASYLPLLDHPDKRVRQGIAALLLDERRALSFEYGNHTSWRERNVATGRALAALDEAAPRMEAALGLADPAEAKTVLLKISRVANEDRSLEELLSIPGASDSTRNADSHDVRY